MFGNRNDPPRREPSIGNKAGAQTALPYTQPHSAESFIPAKHVQLLDKLEHLSRYSHFIQIVIGVAGVGKTTLLKRFYPNSDDAGIHACCIAATHEMGESDLLTELVEQLNLDLAITASVEDKVRAVFAHSELLHDISRQFLIVIDDADRLTEDALDLLVNVLQSMPDVDARPHLVLFGLPKLADTLSLARFRQICDTHGHFIELDPLDLPDMLGLLRHRYGSVIDGLGEKHLQRIHNESFGLPGRVPKVLDKIVAGEAPARPRKAKREIRLPRLSSLHLGLLGGILMLTVAAWLLLPAEHETSDSDRVTVELNIPRPAARQAPEVPSPGLARSVEADSRVSEPDYSTAPVPETGDTELGDLQHRLALAEAALQAEVEAEVPAPVLTPRPAVTPSETQPVAESLPPAPVAVADKPAPVSAPEVVAKVVEKAPSRLVLKLPPPVQKPAPATLTLKPYLREKELLGWNPSGYTLQMLGARNEDSVMEFVGGQADPDAFYYFSTIYKGKPWYVVVYGEYPDRDAAVAGIARLPKVLQQRRPWARSVSGVQNDIRRKK